MSEGQAHHTDGGVEGGSLSARWRALLAVCAVVALAWMIAARVFGPSDLWDQTQPKTVSYTTDIVINGHWILPIERGEFPATKPPLYNWLAAPAVWMMGFDSEIAHKLPSIIALFICWAVLIVMGRRLFPDSGGAVGYLAAMAFVSGYTIFKLGYLARPDMVLTLWVFLGWIAATKLLVDAREESRRPPRQRSLLKLAFWICVALAGLTKGPAAIVLPVFVIIAGKVVTGRWRGGFAIGWWWGVPLCLAMVGLWVWGVWLVDPEHLKTELWYNEIWGRVTGAGPEGSKEGLAGWVKGLAHMPLYYVARFAPWSILSIMAMIELWRPGTRKGSRCIWQDVGPGGLWLMSAVLMVMVVVGLFTLSASKRADYIAPAFAPGALLAGWWLIHARPRIGLQAPWLGPIAAAVCLGAMTFVNQREPAAPQRGFGDQIMAFARDSRATIDERPAPIVFWNAGASHLQAMLGTGPSRVTSPPGTLHITADSPAASHDPVLSACIETSVDALRRRVIEDGQPFWLVEGRPTGQQMSFSRWCADSGLAVGIQTLAHSAELPRTNDWPEQVTLRWVQPPARD